MEGTTSSSTTRRLREGRESQTAAAEMRTGDTSLNRPRDSLKKKHDERILPGPLSYKERKKKREQEAKVERKKGRDKAYANNRPAMKETSFKS